jgi:hypothetical protein
MAGGWRRASLEKRQLEKWLTQVLVPVEPSARFLRRLRARLVNYRGDRLMSGWMVIVFLATIVLIAATSLGLFIRALIAWFTLIGLIGRKRRAQSEQGPVTA